MVLKNIVSKHACRELLFFSQIDLKYTSSYFSTRVAVCGKPYYYQHVAKYMICVWTAGRHRCCVVVERFSFIILWLLRGSVVQIIRSQKEAPSVALTERFALKKSSQLLVSAALIHVLIT